MPKSRQSRGQRRGIDKRSAYYAEYRDFTKQIRDNIRRLRLARQLTQEQMEEFELNWRQFQRIESGETANPTLAYLFRIAKALRVSLAELLAD